MWTKCIVLIVVACVGLFLKIWWSRRRLRHLASKIPGPPTIPLLGNVLLLLGGPVKIFEKVCNEKLKYVGQSFRIWLGPILFVSLMNADDVEFLLTKQRIINRDGFVMKVCAALLGDGIIMARDEKWRKERKILGPTFQTKILESYMGVFNKQASILVNKLDQLADGRTFDIYENLALCTLDMICESIMGVEMNVQSDDSQEVVKNLNRLIQITNKRVYNPWLAIDSIYNLTAWKREEIKSVKVLKDIAQKVISNKMKTYQENSVCDQERKKSFLDHYITSTECEKAYLSEEKLRDEVYNIIFAGQETSATTISFTLLFLALHPQIQEQLNQELREVFADDWERAVLPEDVKQMQLLDRVIKETLRLVPPLMMFTRYVEKETTLRTCTLPAGCIAVIFSYFNHRDPRFFSDPERFDPDRFLPERTKERHPYSYIPFGAGPRICLGFKYAEMAMSVVLANLLKKYRVLPAITHESVLQLEIGIIARPAAGFPVKLIRR